MKKQTDTVHYKKGTKERCGNIWVSLNESAIQNALTTVYICDVCKTKWAWSKE